MMKSIVFLLALWFSKSIEGFTTVVRPSKLHNTQLNMFGGAGAGVPSEDNPEEMKKMEEAAKAMGMSLEEYKLGMAARVRLAEALNKARVSGGNKDTVSVERDGNNPPTFIQISITEAGKALGKEKLSSELVTALKNASDKSRDARKDEQQKMMSYIGEEMKKIGSK
jgi:DNA-binding protein YbaB